MNRSDNSLCFATTKTERWYNSPIFWLLIGPPVLRVASRGAEESIAGNIDAWVLFRLIWWGTVGAWVVASLVGHRSHVRVLLRNNPLLTWGVSLLAAGALYSIFPSPSQFMTMSFIALLLILIGASLDLAIRIERGVLRFSEIATGILIISIAILAVITAYLLISPSMVLIQGHFGFRVVPLQGINTHLLAVVTLICGLYFLFTGKEFSRKLGVLGIGFGLPMLLLSQARAGYVAFVSAVLALIWFSVRFSGHKLRLLVLSLIFLAGPFVFLFAALTESLLGPGFNNVLLDRMVRDWETLTTLSGRLGMWAIAINTVLDSPFGIGFVAGPRALMQQSVEELFVYGVVAHRIGNIHNGYFEILVGTGIFGAIGFMMILGQVMTRIGKRRAKGRSIFLVLFCVVLVFGLIGSEMVVPLNQASALFWIGVAVMSAKAPRRQAMNAGTSEGMPALYGRS